MRLLLLFPFMLACSHPTTYTSPPVGVPRAEAPSSASHVAEPELPLNPSREAVGQTLRDVSPRASECGRGQLGVATARLVFLSSGEVGEVSVSGVPPEVAECVAAAARQAWVPPFQRATFNVNFPFRVR